MLKEEQIKEEAQRLHKAETEKVQVSATTTRFPKMGIRDAYAIQKTWMELKQVDGRKIVGHKIGLTSRVI